MTDIVIEVLQQSGNDLILHAPDLNLVFSQSSFHFHMSNNDCEYQLPYIELVCLCECCNMKTMDAYEYRYSNLCLNCINMAFNAYNGIYLYRLEEPYTHIVIVSIANDSNLLTYNYHTSSLTWWNTYWYYDTKSIIGFINDIYKPEFPSGLCWDRFLYPDPNFWPECECIIKEKIPELIKKYHLITSMDQINNVSDIWTEIFEKLLQILQCYQHKSIRYSHFQSFEND